MDPGDFSSDRLFAVVLAAGESRRFGGAKLLETLDGETLVRRAARLARSCAGDRSVLVTGHRARDVAAAASDECAFVLENPRYREGLGTSIAAAALALSGRADALLLLLADQPLIDEAHLVRLIAARGGDDDIVATAFAGTRGPPVLMSKGTFRSLADLRGDQGARALFADPRFRVRVVEFEPARLDIDTADDLETLRRELR